MLLPRADTTSEATFDATAAGTPATAATVPVTGASRRRHTRRAEWLVAAVALAALGAVVPLGIADSGAVELAARALGERAAPSAPGAANPLAETLVRAAVLFLPFGEAGTRPHAVAALAAAVALALIAARRSTGGTPPSTATMTATAAAIAAAIFVGVSRPFLDVATARAPGAVDLALLLGLALLLEEVRRAPARPRVGLGLALAAGLAAAAGWPVRAAAWPAALLLTLRALRRGERWPLLAPTLFVAGAAAALAGVLATSPPPGLRDLFRAIVLPPPAVASAAATWPAWSSAIDVLRGFADEVGPLALLAAAVGAPALLARRRAEAALGTLVAAVAAIAAWRLGDPGWAMLVAAAALAAPAATGVGQLAAALGRARAPAALALGVMIVCWPAVVGLGGALAAPARRTPAAIARRMDARMDALAGSPAAADAPASADATATPWWRYARATGLVP